MTAPVVSIRKPGAIDRAAALLRNGSLVVVPTDTIYGISALPSTTTNTPDESVSAGDAVRADEVVQRIYDVRGREPEPALPFLLASMPEMGKLTRPNLVALRLGRRFWPGALTVILPPASDLPAVLRAGPIAVRVPNFRPLVSLIEMVGGSLLTTGAIRPGLPPAITSAEAAELFGDDVALILDGGRAPYGIPSTIVDCVPDPPVIIRRGIIPDERIWQAIQSDDHEPSLPDMP